MRKNITILVSKCFLVCTSIEYFMYYTTLEDAIVLNNECQKTFKGVIAPTNSAVMLKTQAGREDKINVS